jgi:ADP-ribose pyrophosphatase YjhB (NUDIX family)
VSDPRLYPKLPVPAVGAITFYGDNVLLIQRGRKPSIGKWTLPGGVVELGESPIEALRREILEECNISIEIGDVVEVVSRVVRDEANRVQYHYVIIDYVAIYKDGNLKPDSDILDARWVLLSEIKKYDLTEDLLPVIERAVMKYKSMHL